MASSGKGSQKPVRLLVLTSTYPRWADDTDPGFVHELSRRLVKRGFTVDVLAPRGPGSKDRELIDGVNVVRYAYFFRRFEVLAYGGGILPKLKANPALFVLIPFLLLGLHVAIRRMLRRSHYGAVHAHWIIPQGLCACVAIPDNGPPVLVTSHGGDLFGLRSGMLAWIKKWTLNHCSKVAVVSGYMRDVVVRDFDLPVERISVLPMGVDLGNRFANSADIERSQDRLLFVGRLVEKKGVRYLLAAMEKLQGRFPELTLDIIGDGPLKADLVALADAHGITESVTFHGALPQQKLPEFYQRSAAAVVPSIVDENGDQEGLGLVTIEAMGCGCPVVASDLPAIRDVVEDEITGLLAEPGNSEQLAAQLSRLLSDREQADLIAQRGRQFVLSRFDWERSADDYAQTLQALSASD